ncbi:MAG: TetR/AcrR family transcriptional regulator [Solirubrobacteraceae bacterium]
MPRPKQRTPELRDHVLSVAMPLLARDGAGGFTARSIAREAQTSPPAIYELFGDKAGLVRELFFAGFRLLGERLEAVRSDGDPRAELIGTIEAYRGFIRDHAVLAEVMFSRPFTDFEPGPAELEASASVRVLVVERVSRCIEAGVLSGDATDIAHVLVALTQGLAAAEQARRLGSSAESIDRRWRLGVEALLGSDG